MMNFEQALLKTVEAIRTDGGDYKTSYRYAAFSTLAMIYGVDIKHIYEAGNVLDIAYAEEQKRKKKEQARTENEARRLANIAAGGKHKEPKQYKLEIGIRQT